MSLYSHSTELFDHSINTWMLFSNFLQHAGKTCRAHFLRRLFSFSGQLIVRCVLGRVCILKTAELRPEIVINLNGTLSHLNALHGRTHRFGRYHFDSAKVDVDSWSQSANPVVSRASSCCSFFPGRFEANYALVNHQIKDGSLVTCSQIKHNLTPFIRLCLIDVSSFSIPLSDSDWLFRASFPNLRSKMKAKKKRKKNRKERNSNRTFCFESRRY